jgi:hypothetical protein
MTEDNSFYAEVLILDAGARWAKVFVLREHKLTVDEQTEEQQEFKIQWSGPSAKFKVIRLSDRETLQDGMATKIEAEVWLSDYKKALAA